MEPATGQKKRPHTGGRKKHLSRWQERMNALGIEKIPSWKKTLLRISDDLRYYISDEDLDFILVEANEIQVENVMRRYRLA